MLRLDRVLCVEDEVFYTCESFGRDGLGGDGGDPGAQFAGDAGGVAHGCRVIGGSFGGC